MFIKFFLISTVLCLPACLDTKKKAEHIKVITDPKKTIRPSKINVWPIERIPMIQTFINNHLARGFNPAEILVIFDVDETLLENYAIKNNREKQLLASSLFPHIANNILIKNIPDYLVKKIGINNIDINKPDNLLKYVDKSLIDTTVIKTLNIIVDLYNKGLLNTKATELHIGKFIQSLQKRGIHTMALTARIAALKEKTALQLQNAKINFSDKAIYDKEIKFINKHHSFSNGVLFSGIDKGKILLELLQAIDYSPTLVIFVDDNAHFIDNVRKALLKKYPNVIFYGLHYIFKAKNEFDSELAESLLISSSGKKWWALDNSNMPIGTKKESSKQSLQ